MKPIYLDYNATTPLAPEVIRAMLPFLENVFGNPSSVHSFGLEAKKAVEKARKQIADLLHVYADEIIFTSGGTESNNLAIKGVAFSRRGRGNHIITSSIEHPAVIEVCIYLQQQGFQVTFLPVDSSGRINPLDVERSIKPETILITIMHANNEVGTIQPIREISEIARRRNILFHTDAAQTIGKIPVNLEEMKVDLLSVAGHKFYAPKGIGALYVRRGVRLEKQLHGADHESNVRAGTENVMQIAGLGEAAEVCSSYDTRNLKMLRDLLHNGICKAIPEVRLNGHSYDRLPNTLSLGFPGVEAAFLLNTMKDVAASAGAACHADQEEISGVLTAMNVSRDYAIGTIRFSVGRMTTEEEVIRAIPVIVEGYQSIKGQHYPGKRKIISSTVKLTEYTHSLGCACKIRPQLLEKILRDLPVNSDPDILVDHRTSDDAAVYLIREDFALVQTVDFIPPVVDDPYDYGAIAAANALSDIYAMGGDPLFALSIVAFPDGLLPLEVLHQILKGAADKAAEAGISIIGGHSIEDHEPKFGLVVTGKVHPDKIIRNSTAMAGDVLILTKPIGTGILSTAMKRGMIEPEIMEQVISSMSELNRTPAAIMKHYQVNACTDVTGFGLLGHLKEILKGSGLLAEIDSSKVPVLSGTWESAAAGAIPGGTLNNLEFVADIAHWEESVPEILRFILADAQTSGGLLISVPVTQADAMLKELNDYGCLYAGIIGCLKEGDPEIYIR